MQNWFDVMPNDIARRQIAYELDAKAWRMRGLGFTFKQIGERLGVGPARAQDRVARYERQRLGRLSPVEAYLGRPDLNVKQLADGLIKRGAKQQMKRRSLAYMVMGG